MDRATLIAAMQSTAAQAPVAVEVKGWGTVYVRSPTVAEVDADLQRSKEAADADDAAGVDKHRIARGAARVICDAEGRRLFDPASAEDLALLAAQPWSMLRKVTAAVEDDDAGNSASATS